MGTDISQLKAQHQQFITKKVDLENQKTNKDASLQDATTKSANAASQVDAANANLETSKSNLANAQSELSSFQVVEAPDKASYTITETDENGNEIENFDSDAFEAAQKAHEESVQKKQELENNVKTAETEVQTSESNVSEAEQSKTAADNEVTTISGKLDQISTEISATDAKISEIETQIQEYEDGSYSISGSDKNGSITTNYDKDGNITSKTETDKDGNEIYKEYDENGKEISSKTVYKDGKEVYKEYDENGETYKATYNKDGSQVYERFDENGNAKEKIFVNDKNMQIQVFDENGKLKEVRDINDKNQVITREIDKNGKQTITNIQPGDKDSERIRAGIKEDFVPDVGKPKEISKNQTANDLAKEMVKDELNRLSSDALTSKERDKILNELVSNFPEDKKQELKQYLFMEGVKEEKQDEIINKYLSAHINEREEQIRMYNNGQNVFKKGDTAIMPVTQEEIKMEGSKNFLQQVANSASNNYENVEVAMEYSKYLGQSSAARVVDNNVRKENEELIKDIQRAADKGDFAEMANDLTKFTHGRQNVSKEDLANIYDKLTKNPNDKEALKQLSDITGKEWTSGYEKVTVDNAKFTKVVSTLMGDAVNSDMSASVTITSSSSGSKTSGTTNNSTDAPVGRMARFAKKGTKRATEFIKDNGSTAAQSEYNSYDKNLDTGETLFNLATDIFMPVGSGTVQLMFGTTGDELDYSEFKKKYKNIH